MHTPTLPPPILEHGLAAFQPIETDQLKDTLRRAAADYCREHDLMNKIGPITDAFMVAALHTMRWQNERAIMHRVAIADAIDCQPCIQEHCLRGQTSALRPPTSTPQEARP